MSTEGKIDLLQTQRHFESGNSASIKSSVVPRYDLIPTKALERLAKRFETGIERKGKDASWNALNASKHDKISIEFIQERISHIIYHAFKLRDKIATEDWEGIINGDDDAAAIAWGGIFLSEIINAVAEEQLAQES